MIIQTTCRFSKWILGFVHEHLSANHKLLFSSVPAPPLLHPALSPALVRPLTLIYKEKHTDEVGWELVRGDNTRRITAPVAVCTQTVPPRTANSKDLVITTLDTLFFLCFPVAKTDF